MSFELTLEEGKFLIELTRSAVEAFLGVGQTFKPSKDTPQKLYEKCGVFVTINAYSREEGEKTLRGCIGYPYPTSSLVEAVIDSAINAATEDPRFPSMTFGELDKCVFEVSVLTPPELIQVGNPKEYIQQIQVGQDGLIVEKGYNRGLLLPQVPVEWQWCEEEFLCQCCMKAGLPADSWLTKGVKIYKFAAIVFEEQTPKGEIKRLNLR
ncbi:MAG: TIGR00296 family protein [Candidatus Bathyarchaeota archaeon]|nr:TIGR00296 family protein [Candidatus Termiticorpusculum sp.]